MGAEHVGDCLHRLQTAVYDPITQWFRKDPAQSTDLYLPRNGRKSPSNPRGRFLSLHDVVVRSSKDALRQSTSLTAPAEKNLDATKLYAHPSREHGRYGSHPSHDGFDHESGLE